MTSPAERRVRLTAAAIGIATAVAAAGLVAAVFVRNNDPGSAIVFSLTVALPMLWAAPVVLLAHRDDGLNAPRWRKWTLRAAGLAVAATGGVFAAGLTEYVRGDGFVNFVPAAVTLPFCFSGPAGLVCLAYLVALVAKRLFREPDPE